MKSRKAVYVLAVLGIAGAAGWALMSPPESSDEGRASQSAAEPAGEQPAGRNLFEKNCAVCHGTAAMGTDQGPPLVHRIYEPSHHGDMAFVLAARQGVRAHHWRFGDMPAIEGVSDQDALEIAAYVRALQRANGIE